MKEAEECGFTPSAKKLAYSATVDSTVWKAHLLHGIFGEFTPSFSDRLDTLLDPSGSGSPSRRGQSDGNAQFNSAIIGGGARPIPFINAASKEEIEKFASGQPAKIAFKDEIDIITFTKIITRTPTIS